MHKFFYLIFLPVLTSCAFVPEEWLFSQSFKEMHSSSMSYKISPPPPQSFFTGSQTVYQNNYVLNETTTVKVGETVLRVQAFKKEDFVSNELILDQPVKVKIGTDSFTLPAKKYPIFGMFKYGGESYFVLQKLNRYYFLVDMDGLLQRMFLYEVKGRGNRVTIFPDRAKLFPETARLKRVSFFRQEKTPFLDFEVIYDGIKNNQIVLFYKNAVPGTDGGSGSFDTLSYPADSTMISVAGRLLRIIRADKEQMTYIVVKE